MRLFYYFLGTGTEKDKAWFRPLSNEISFPEADWAENVDETPNCQQSPQENQINAGEMDEDMEEESTKNQKIATLEIAVSKIVTSVEHRFENDPKNFTKAIKSFVKKEERIITANDACLQKALFTFSHEYFAPASRGRRKKGSRIPVQVTARSHRKIKHRGSGPSIPGRPTNKQSLRPQMQVYEDEDFVAHSIPSRSKTKRKQPHSLASAVASNRASAKKH